VARHGSDLLPDVAPALRGPVEDYLTHIELERGLSRNTVDAYARDLGRYLAWLAEREASGLDEVTETDLLAFRAQLEEAGLAPASRARIVVAVRRLHDHLLGEGVTTRDPAAALPPPRQAERLRCWRRPRARSRSSCGQRPCSSCSTRPVPASARRWASTSTTST
jgi:integrase/recombinase XerD